MKLMKWYVANAGKRGILPIHVYLGSHLSLEDRTIMKIARYA